MVTTLLAIYGLADLVLLSASFRLRSSWPLWLVRALLFGMLWDNAVLALSGWGIGSNWYELVNYPRFVFHAAFLPFLTLFGLAAMRASAIKAAQSTIMLGFCWLFTGCALLYGFFEDVYNLEFATREFQDHLRLTSASTTPPLATIATNILLLPMALSVWVRGKYPWLFLGTLFIFLVNGATGGQAWGILAGNGAEVVFTTALLVTTLWMTDASRIARDAALDLPE